MNEDLSRLFQLFTAQFCLIHCSLPSLKVLVTILCHRSKLFLKIAQLNGDILTFFASCFELSISFLCLLFGSRQFQFQFLPQNPYVIGYNNRNGSIVIDTLIIMLSWCEYLSRIPWSSCCDSTIFSIMSTILASSSKIRLSRSNCCSCSVSCFCTGQKIFNKHSY